MQEKKVLVIGAGIAGITAACHLARKNVHVTLIEASDSLGGRSKSFYDQKAGEYYDNGQHLMVGAYPVFFETLKMLGTFGNLVFQDSLSFAVADPGGKKYDLKSHRLPGILAPAAGILTFKGLSLKARLEILTFAAKVRIGLIRAKKGTCLADLTEYGQGEESIKGFWEPLIVSALNTDMNIASTSLFLNVLRDSFFKGKAESALVFPSSTLAALLAPLEEGVTGNIDIRKNSVIKSLLLENNRPNGVRLANGEEIYGDRIILAVSWKSLYKLLKDSQIENTHDISQLKDSPILSAYFWTDREFMKEDIVQCRGRHVHWIFNKRKLLKSPETKPIFPGYICLTVSAANETASYGNEEIADIFWKEVQDLLPEAKGVKLMHYKIVKEKAATFLADMESEKIRARIPSEVNGFLLCGDWTDTGYPSTLEGAAMSGKHIANQLLKEMNR